MFMEWHAILFTIFIIISSISSVGWLCLKKKIDKLTKKEENEKYQEFGTNKSSFFFELGGGGLIYFL